MVTGKIGNNLDSDTDIKIVTYVTIGDNTWPMVPSPFISHPLPF